MNFQRETVQDVMGEITPLLKAHYHEISADHYIPLEPNWDGYQKIESAGAFRIFTARAEDGRLIGYNCFFINHNLHYKSSLQAVQDVIYIDKERRGFGQSFINWCDAQLKAEGVQKVYHHVKAKHNFGPMLERNGYALVDLIFAKRLDK